MTNPILTVRELSVEFNLKQQKEIKKIKAIEQIDLDIYRGEMMGIIGESGSGKSTLAFAILNLIDAPGVIASGQVQFIKNDGQALNVLELDSQQENEFRWKEIATVFQAAQSALNPIQTVYDHFVDTYQAHTTRAEALDANGLRLKVEELCAYVRLDKNVLKMYPFELSGGMKQRVLIALSLLLDPSIIILDEPTTALDVITQWYILDILKKINREKNVTIIFLTHDISIISAMVDRIVVMYAGQIVEIGKTEDVYRFPAHPYTKALLGAIPTMNDDISSKKAIVGGTYDMLKADGGCRFKNRCQRAKEVGCQGLASDSCQLFEVSETHVARCINRYQEESNER